MRDPENPWQDEIAAATPVPVVGPTEHQLKRQAIQDCTRCDPDGYRGTIVCNHAHQDPATIAQRHLAQIRAKMGWQAPEPTNRPKVAQDKPQPQETASKTDGNPHTNTNHDPD